MCKWKLIACRIEGIWLICLFLFFDAKDHNESVGKYRFSVLNDAQTNNIASILRMVSLLSTSVNRSHTFIWFSQRTNNARR